MPTVLKSGNLNLLEPSGPVQACNGTALPLQGESRTLGKKREKLAKKLSNYKLLKKKHVAWGWFKLSVKCDPLPLYQRICLKTKNMTNSSGVGLAPLRNPTAPPALQTLFTHLVPSRLGVYAADPRQSDNTR